MSVGIAYHSEVTDNATDIYRCFHQNILLPRQFGNSINFFTRIALKAEVIETGFYFILHDDQNENWIFSRRRRRTEPDIVPAFEPSIADDQKTAERRIEPHRSIDIAGIDRDVCPAWRHSNLVSKKSAPPGSWQRVWSADIHVGGSRASGSAFFIIRAGRLPALHSTSKPSHRSAS